MNDRLQINSELESQMALLIDRYQCEWKTTLNDPEKLKRFKSFVNSDNPDSNIVFVNERQQKRPARDQEKSLIVSSA